MSLTAEWFNGQWEGYMTPDPQNQEIKAPFHFVLDRGVGSGAAVLPFKIFLQTIKPLVLRFENTGSSAGPNNIWTFTATESDFSTIKGTYKRNTAKGPGSWNFGNFQVRRIQALGLPALPSAASGSSKVTFSNSSNTALHLTSRNTPGVSINTILFPDKSFTVPLKTKTEHTFDMKSPNTVANITRVFTKPTTTLDLGILFKSS